MDREIVKKMLDEFYPQLEALETRSEAIRQFLKDEGLATDEQFAPYLEQAGKASSVKWLAHRVRMEHLLTSAIREAAKPPEKPAVELGKKPEGEPAEAASVNKAEGDGGKSASLESAPLGQEQSTTDQGKSEQQEKSEPDQKKPAEAA